MTWCLVFGRKHYAVVIQDAYEQAAVQVEQIKAELEFNARLGMDFPDATGRGGVWREGESVTRNQRKIHARGAGQRLRGLKHGARRPDLVVLDDIENDENVRSPEQRDKLHRWRQRAVEHLGEAGEKLDIVYTGTILHYDSVLSRTIANPLWRSVVFRAIARGPDRMDLWERWEEILLNDGEAAADRFHARNRKAMAAGAEVSWPDKRPLVELMKDRARNGHAAFDAEMQNDPLNDEDDPFRHLTYWAQPNPECVLFGSVDPSLGRAANGPDMIAYQRQYPDIALWFVEAVQFQEFFRTTAMNRAVQEGVSLPCMPVQPHNDKELRIAALQPYVAEGTIRVHQGQATLIAQLRHWPKADHDDGPDALEILWKGAVEHGSPADIRMSGVRGAGGGTGFGGGGIGIGRGIDDFLMGG